MTGLGGNASVGAEAVAEGLQLQPLRRLEAHARAVGASEAGPSPATRAILTVLKQGEFYGQKQCLW